MSKELVTTGGINVNSITIETLPGFIQQLQEKLDKVKAPIRKKITNGNLGELDININTETSVVDLIKAKATLEFSESQYKKTVSKMKKTPEFKTSKLPQFTIGDGTWTVEEWCQHIDSRIQELNSQKEIDALEQSLAECQKYLSEENQLKVSLSKIMKNLSI